MTTIGKWAPWGLAVLLGATLLYEMQQRKELEAKIARIEGAQRATRPLIETTPKAPGGSKREEISIEQSRRRVEAEAVPGDIMPGRVRELREFLSRLPDQATPELQLATEGDWYTAAAADGKLESEEEFREALARLRGLAASRFAKKTQPALRSYMSANDGAFPKATADLAPYFEGGMASDILSRYKVVPSSEVPNVRMGGEWIITQSSAIDSDYDSRIVIGPNGFGTSGPSKRKPKK